MIGGFMAKAFMRVAVGTAGSAAAIAMLIGAKTGMGDDAPPGMRNPPTANPTAASPTAANPTVGTQPTGTASTGKDGTYTGDAANTRYGNVQVEITVSGGHISDIRLVQCPSGSRTDQMICQQAGPILVSQGITAQSANISGVSGATFTSQGYQQSLQSAIDKAGL